MNTWIRVILGLTLGIPLILFSLLAIRAAGSASCTLDPPDERHLSSTAGAGYFSPDYATARRRFLDAATESGVKPESLVNPHKGPKGEPLHTDLALLGPAEAKNILVLGSGTHGVEGFAGSAIQTGLLQEGISGRLPPDTAVLMIHAINPYGMAHLRRFNEDNIDINRNFIDHANAYPSNRGYRALAEAIAPPSLSWWSNLQAQFSFLTFRLRNGKDELRQAISGGQYQDPRGLFFGGREDAWSNRTIRELVRQHLSRAERIVLIDIHTGLGPFGGAEIIMSEKKDSPAYDRARRWWGSSVRNTYTGESVSVTVAGPLKSAFVQMLPEAEVTAAALEFGTYPAIDVFHALRNENWLHQHAEPGHARKDEIKSCLLEAFRPDSALWKAAVWRQGEGVVAQTLAALAS